MPERVTVIGAGIAGLSSACFLARNGYHVTIIDNNNGPGGRCRQFSSGGFLFDMGPSWYWMPDVVEKFFQAFGRHPSDFYELKRLDPSYTFFWEDGSKTNVPSSFEELNRLFESYEPGASKKLAVFIKEAELKYRWGMDKLVHIPCNSPAELLIPGMLKDLVKTDVFKSVRAHIKKYFKDPRLQSILQFPVLFLGASPAKIPALYSLMCYADISLGTWYPMGGMGKLPEAMASQARELGVEFQYNENVTGFSFNKNKVKEVITGSGVQYTDHVVGAADYHFIEQKLLPPQLRTYSEAYWNKRIMSPTCLLFYVGVSKKVPGLSHHNLFFDAPVEDHLNDIYQNSELPKKPLFYVCCPSKTDPAVAPEGKENLFILIPLAPGTEETEQTREKYFRQVIERIEKAAGDKFSDSIEVKHSYSGRNFSEDYNAFKGNAYGLANTLMQTAHFRPKMRSGKVSNLIYTGQLTIPGPGLPPAIISGEIASREIKESR